jgi:Tol biopolymer transport system component
MMQASEDIAMTSRRFLRRFLRRFPLGFLLLLPVIAGIGLYACTGGDPVPDPIATPEATSTPTAADTPSSPPVATETLVPVEDPPVFPGGYATPTAAIRGELHPGAWVRVNAGEGDCLNARSSPSMDPQYTIVHMCLPHGFEGYLAGNPTEADGHWWWHMAGFGWVAEEYLQYVRDADLRTKTAPEYSGKGMIAFRRDTDLWIMDASGGSQRRIAERVAYSDVPPAWSPDGHSIMINADAPQTDGTWMPAIRVFNLDANANVTGDRLYSGLWGGGWSPDGRTIGVMTYPLPADPPGTQSRVGVLDVASGAVFTFGSGTQPNMAPFFNFDGSMLMGLASVFEEGTGNSRSAIVVWDPATGAELRRIVETADGGWYSSPVWAPVDNRITFHISQEGRPNYAVYDVDAGAIIARTEYPDPNPIFANRGSCGVGLIWATAWSRDGRFVYFGISDGGTGENGAWLWDPSSGEKRLVQSAGASIASAGPGGLFTFSSDAHIFIARNEGGWPTLITYGVTPSWSP